MNTKRSSSIKKVERIRLTFFQILAIGCAGAAYGAMLCESLRIFIAATIIALALWTLDYMVKLYFREVRKRELAERKARILAEKLEEAVNNGR